MGGALDRFVLPFLVDAGSTDCAGMGDEHRGDASERRSRWLVVPSLEFD